MTIRFDEQASVFVASCPVTGVISQGETADEAREALHSAIRLYLKARRERGITAPPIESTIEHLHTAWGETLRELAR